ncbi:FadR/GntR family transcriptional regulator [Aquibium pacificus]|uniref:FadR/GntR family transcriptional regulator n=1 Tax=Aquibium pacificus TaxID=3153579 RepID=UPI00359F71CE
MLKSAISGTFVRNSHSHVVNELGKSIVSGVYKPGTVLPGDAELAARFEVSRTVLREAMKTLTAKGLVVPKARIGTRVTPRITWNLFDADVLNWHLDSGVDRTFLNHLSEMRLAFEPFAARLACAKASRQDIDALYTCAEAMRRADSVEAFALADLDFHIALLDASRNPFMYSVGNLIEAALVTSFRISSPFGQPDRHMTSAENHRLIVDAISAGDADAAAKAVEVVIVEGRERVDATVAAASP